MADKAITTTPISVLPAIAIEIDGQQALIQVVQRLGHDAQLCSSAQLQEIADRLSQVAGGGKTADRSWGRAYLRNVINGKQGASGRLAHACVALLAEMSGESSLVTRSHPVQVLALGEVMPGAVVLASSRRCANPACPVHFVPRTPNQVHCSRDCRIAHARNKGK